MLNKAMFPILVILVLVAVVWIGLSIYLSSSKLNIDPNASTYTTYINGTFDTEKFNDLIERRKNNLPVGTETFTVLIQQ